MQGSRIASSSRGDESSLEREARSTSSRAPVARGPLVRSPSVTGSVSGSASPATRYGSFPPATDEAKDMLEEILRRKLHKRRWERSQERLIPPGTGCDDVFDSDADLSDDPVHEPSKSPPYSPRSPDSPSNDDAADAVWNAGDDLLTTHPPRRTRTRDEGAKQWGVQKMELMSMVWGKRGLSLIYAG